MIGLQYLDASIFQMIRGSALVFVALLKQHVLKDHLVSFIDSLECFRNFFNQCMLTLLIQYKFHWVGIFWIASSVAIASSAAFFLSASLPVLPSLSVEGGGGGSESISNITTSQVLLGVCLVIIGTFLQACNFVSEEHIMRMAIPAPPLLLIGMEGLWGVVLCIFIMFPVG